MSASTSGSVVVHTGETPVLQDLQFPGATMLLFYRLFIVVTNAVTMAPNFACLSEASGPGRSNPQNTSSFPLLPPRLIFFIFLSVCLFSLCSLRLYDQRCFFIDLSSSCFFPLPLWLESPAVREDATFTRASASV